MGKKKEKRPMSITHPKLALEFDREKNFPLTPENTPAGTNKRLNWICSKCEHSWPAQGNARSTASKPSGCPPCAWKKAITLEQSVSATNPEVAATFSKRLNGKLSTDSISPGSRVKVWWLCEKCETPWIASVSERCSKGRKPTGCPACNKKKIKSCGTNSMASTHPHLLQEFDREKNHPLTPETIFAGTSKKLHWLCRACGDSWKATGNGRSDKTNPIGCPACVNQKVHSDGRNAMRSTHPELALEFDIEKNWPHTPDSLVAGANVHLHWICSTCKNKWRTMSSARAGAGVSGGSGCPYCRSTYTASEHLSNHYVKFLLEPLGLRVDIEPGSASIIYAKNRRRFQIDARIQTIGGLVAYLYDGGGWHKDDVSSIEHDVKRRKGLSQTVFYILAHRHGMRGIQEEVGCHNYAESVTPDSASILSGVLPLLSLASGVGLTLTQSEVEEVFKTAMDSWRTLPNRNELKLSSLIRRERKALRVEKIL